MKLERYLLAGLKILNYLKKTWHFRWYDNPQWVRPPITIPLRQQQWKSADSRLSFCVWKNYCFRQLLSESPGVLAWVVVLKTSFPKLCSWVCLWGPTVTVEQWWVMWFTRVQCIELGGVLSGVLSMCLLSKIEPPKYPLPLGSEGTIACTSAAWSLERKLTPTVWG